jgi:hypothetical protein
MILVMLSVEAHRPDARLVRTVTFFVHSIFIFLVRISLID